MLTFTLHGAPAPQGSKRHVGRGIMVESSKRLPAWRQAMVLQLRNQHQGQQPLDGPIKVTAAFFMPRPRRPKFTEPAVPPDLDKLQRALGDALTTAGVITDDARITTWVASKNYDPDGFTGVHLEIKEAQ